MLKKKKRKEFCIKEPWQEKINNTSLVRETADNVFLSILNFVTLEKSWYYFDMKDLYLCQKFKSEKKKFKCLFIVLFFWRKLLWKFFFLKIKIWREKLNINIQTTHWFFKSTFICDWGRHVMCLIYEICMYFFKYFA